MDFSEKLAKQRRRLGMSQEQLADRLGVTRQSVSKWESGNAVPELGKLIALSTLFGVSVDYLVKDWVEEEPVALERPEEKPDSGAVRLEKKLDDLTRYYRGYRYTSKRKLFGLPLLSICFTHHHQPCRGAVAVGIVAIGNYSVGLVSIGVLSLGIVSVGMVSLGLLVFGMVAVGILALGMAALGVVAVGMAAMGIYAFGASAMGMKLAVGLAANGAAAIGRKAEGVRVLLTGSGVTPEQVAEFLRPELEGLWPPLRGLLLALARGIGG